MASFSSITTAVSVIIKGYLKGLFHAVNIFDALKILCSGKSIFLGVLKIIGANMFLIVGSDIFLNKFILPLIQDYGMWIYDDTNMTNGEENIILLPTWVEYLSSLIYFSLWLFPIWILIYLAVNIPTYAEIASIAFIRENQSKDKVIRKSSVEEEIYRFIFFFFLILQKYTLRALPEIGISYFNLSTIGKSISFIFSMLICSLSAFEYTWHQQGVPVAKRHAYIEHAWPYFLGFGTPATVLTFFFPLFVSLGLSACLFPFPLFLAMTNIQSSQYEFEISSQYIPKLQMFNSTRDVTEKVASFLVSLILGKKSDYIATLKLREGKDITTTTYSNTSKDDVTSTSTTTVRRASSGTGSTSSSKNRKLASPPNHLKDDILRARSLGVQLEEK